MNQSQIRNFCIIAHVDHGKSTLADRILEMTGTVEKRNMMEQVLDSNPIERERGITIKLASVRIKYQFEDQEYELNLIDTPGHVDFSYEVVRTLYACEGAVLLVDATKGIQAQTVANFNFAKKLGLKIIPAINKIDLPLARVEEAERELIESFGFSKDEILSCIVRMASSSKFISYSGDGLASNLKLSRSICLAPPFLLELGSFFFSFAFSPALGPSKFRRASSILLP